jgi:hypothetical protein
MLKIHSDFYAKTTTRQKRHVSEHAKTIHAITWMAKGARANGLPGSKRKAGLANQKAGIA